MTSLRQKRKKGKTIKTKIVQSGNGKLKSKSEKVFFNDNNKYINALNVRFDRIVSNMLDV